MQRPLTKLACLLGMSFLALTPLAGTMQQQAPPESGQILRVLTNKSVVINTQAPIVRIMTGNPAVIETVATTPTQIVLTGKTPGNSSLIIWDTPDRSQLLDVLVEPDISGLRGSIERSYPGQQINVETDGARIILTGTVSSQKIAEDLAKIAALYSSQVINSLAVASPPPQRDKQVMLEVKFVEVDRSKLSNFGLNILSTGIANTPGAISTQQFGPPSLTSVGGNTATTLTVTDILNIFLFRPDLNLGVTIKALEQQALLQVLAEPNLLALNGQKASFLAGGEFPYPIVQSAGGNSVVTIQFRPFGIKLDFTGTIDGDVVRLQVAPEVSTLDFANAASVAGTVVPAFTTRRAETSIELKNGQTFGIAGLMDRRLQTQFSKIPGIGDIPIIGKLFQSKNINRGNTELVVLVTPHIVDPVNVPGTFSTPQLPLPFLEPRQFDTTLPGNRDAGTSTPTR